MTFSDSILASAKRRVSTSLSRRALQIVEQHQRRAMSKGQTISSQIERDGDHLILRQRISTHSQLEGDA